MQLCAQAVCLEEMFGAPVPEGALFYGQKRRRTAVAFDAELRGLTARIAQAARDMIVARHTPRPVRIPGCRACSLEDICRPDRLETPPDVDRWLRTQLAVEGAPAELPEPVA